MSYLYKLESLSTRAAQYAKSIENATYTATDCWLAERQGTATDEMREGVTAAFRREREAKELFFQALKEWWGYR